MCCKTIDTWMKKDSKNMMNKVGRKGDAVTEIQSDHPCYRLLKLHSCNCVWILILADCSLRTAKGNASTFADRDKVCTLQEAHNLFLSLYESITEIAKETNSNSEGNASLQKL